jgi:hypothetical protein
MAATRGNCKRELVKRLSPVGCNGYKERQICQACTGGFGHAPAKYDLAVECHQCTVAPHIGTSRL